MDQEKVINVAVVVSGLDEEYQYNIIRGINKFAEEHNINVSYFAAFGGMVGSKTFDIGETSIYNLIEYKHFDGVLLMTNTFGDKELRERILNKVRKAALPTVIFESHEFPEFYDISIDNHSVMKNLINHIIKVHGAKVINYVSGPLANPEGKARYDAFISTMEENGLAVDERRIFYGDFKSYDGKLAVDAFVASGLPLPDAFICANDSMALTTMSALEKLGYKIPDDVMITGFDNTFNARNGSPALTSVKRPLFKAGYQASEILFNVINGIEQPSSTVLEATPVFNESCGCKDAETDDLTSYKKITYRKIEVTNRNLLTMNRLTAGLAETETASEYFDVIEKIIGELDCEKFQLCLSENWQDVFNTSPSVSLPHSYSSYMTAPLIWDKGQRRSTGYFPSSKMFPEGFEDRSCVNYFLPLHFSDRCLGYYIITNGDFPIYSLLCHTLTMVLSNSIENIRKLFHLNKAMDELNRLYVIDPLCNIYNRNGFINVADDLFNECAAKKQQIMLSFIDMDGLKYINDNYGHNEGDFAIQRLASIINSCCGKGRICARFGGDEFVIFTIDADETDAATLEHKFNTELENINQLVKKPYTISASIGSIITVAGENDTLYSVIKMADDKMYEIKKQKKRARKTEKI